MRIALSNRVLYEKNELTRLMHRLELSSPSRRIEDYRRQVDDLLTAATGAVVNRVRDARIRIEHIMEKLELLSVNRILERGFSLVWKDGRIVRSAGELSPSESVRIQFAVGEADATIEKIELNPEGNQ